MFSKWLDKTFTITRTSTTKNSVTHIAKNATQTLGPYPCRIGRASSTTGVMIQTQPQAVYTQSLRMYTVVGVDVKAGDIVSASNGDKYTVNNVYNAAEHHLECDITLKQEV